MLITNNSDDIRIFNILFLSAMTVTINTARISNVVIIANVLPQLLRRG